MRDGKLAVLPVLVHHTAESDLISFFGTRIEPNVAHFEPIVGLFELPTVNDNLLENAVIVKDAESVCGIIARRERVHICGGKSAKTAVTEPSVGLESIDFVHFHAETFNRFRHLVGDTHVEKMVAKGSPEQKFHGHIVDLFCVLGAALFFEVDTLGREQISDDHASCAVDLRLAGVFGFDAEITGEHAGNMIFDFLLRNVEFHILSFLPLSPGRKIIIFSFFMRRIVVAT